MGLSVIVITKNEARDLPRALASVAFADELIVVDSGSTDGTQAIARGWGAKVVETGDWPGFGPQKNRALNEATQEWVLSLDADEWLEPDLIVEIQEVISTQDAKHKRDQIDAYRIRRQSVFIDRLIRFGDWRGDKVLRLFRRGRARFSDDLVHERLVVKGLTGELRAPLGHFSVRSVEDSRAKMWNYNTVAAAQIARQNRGGRIKGFFKAIFSVFRALVLRAGIFDGLRGLQLAWYNARGTYLRYAIAQNIQDQTDYCLKRQSRWQLFRDACHLFIVDHGFLRVLYANRFRLAGGLYRANQPSPGRLSAYKRVFGIRSVVNLRGKNEQLGWYRMEKNACERLGLNLVNIQVYSRGLVDRQRLKELREAISTLELPALVHCKSGADRAGFFSVLYRHYRLGEPIEDACHELGLKFGHSRYARTGVLDYFFETFVLERSWRQTFTQWSHINYDADSVQSSFKPKSIPTFLVDRLLGRE